MAGTILVLKIKEVKDCRVSMESGLDGRNNTVQLGWNS